MKIKLFGGLFLISLVCIAQESSNPRNIEATYFYGSIFEHNKDVAHLITGHPEGVILSYNNLTYGKNAWEQRYNYPDWGYSFIYQDPKNEALGDTYGLYAHYSFYFLNRNLKAKVGQGIAIATNPFDLQSNFKNIAYGSRLLSSTFVQLGYDKKNLFKRWGVHAGISLVHYSNANVKAPNTSTNTIAFYAGISYDLNNNGFPEYIKEQQTPYTEPFRLNAVIRGGINESDYVGLGQQPFVVLSGFVDKRLNHKSTIQAGVDVFFSTFLKKEIEYIAASFPRRNLSADTDYKRVGVFLGHELRFGRIAFVTQFGFYLYYPYDFEGRFYQRIGLKRYFGDRFFGVVTLKSHAAKAEAIEFGFGMRFN